MFDWIISQGKIVDGSGSDAFKADIAIRDGVIVGVGRFGRDEAKNYFDASGFTVSPGFVDSHSHSDLAATSGENMDSKIVQGVTTEITGNCGLTLSPVSPEKLVLVKSYLTPFIPNSINLEWNWENCGELMRLGDLRSQATDMALLTGHGSIRIAVMGFDNRKPTQRELRKMKELLEIELDAGAIGMSSGLLYPPGCYSEPYEMIELCKILAARDRIYTTHLRSESADEINAIKEALYVAKESGCKLHISHHKVMRDCEGNSNITLALFEAANEAGGSVTLDVYPYTVGSTLISSLLPPWVSEGGVGVMLQRLGDYELRERIKREWGLEISGWDNLVKCSSFENIVISRCNNHEWQGKSVNGISVEMGCASDEALLNIISETHGDAIIALDCQSATDNENIIKNKLSMICSDSFPSSYIGKLSQGLPHPRCFGSFPKVLGHFVREKRVLSVEQAINKMTAFPAKRFGLKDRGMIAKNMIADIVVFSEEEIADESKYDTPLIRPRGIRFVMKSGEIVVENGVFSGKKCGRFIPIGRWRGENNS